MGTRRTSGGHVVGSSTSTVGRPVRSTRRTYLPQGTSVRGSGVRHTVDSSGREEQAVAVTIETYHQDDQWHVRREGERTALSSHATKDEAIAAGRTVAQREKAEHIIKNLDGTIAEKNSYGNDPRNVPG